MAQASGIEWTESTWNPVTGCTKISPGCKHCYAERMAKRLRAMAQANYVNGFGLTLQPHMLELPIGWKKPQTIFVNSMSDLFHKDVPLAYIRKIFEVMARAHWHRFQVLTKRADRLAELSPELTWTPNIWMGVSVENDMYRGRIADLRATRAQTKFLSLEPLLGPLRDLDLAGIDWVIVGGESGPRARPMDVAWVTDLRDQCRRAKVPFFFKQWGGKNKKKAGRQLEGRTWDEMPCEAAMCDRSRRRAPAPGGGPVMAPAQPNARRDAHTYAMCSLRRRAARTSRAVATPPNRSGEMEAAR